MFRRAAVVCIAVVMMSTGALPAEASRPKPLTLQSYVISVGAPNAPATICDQGSWLNCGFVSVAAKFAGLDGRPRPAEPGAPSGNLTGTVHVSRTYGCQHGTHRLNRYDRRVEEEAFLNTRRGFGFSTPVSGNILSVTAYAFLLDAQPGNCPAGAQAVTYEIRASNAKLSLVSVTAPFPSAHYPAPGKAQWRGAVPTPTVDPASSR